MPRAAVLTARNHPLEILDLALQPPRMGEVLVRLAASGICHSDRSLQEGTVPVELPIVLGHEGEGVVEEVGPEVPDLKPGDHVVLSWIPQCGQCYFCTMGQPELCATGWVHMIDGTLLDGTTRFSRNGQDIHQAVYCGTFSEQTVVPAMCAVKIDSDFPLQLAALIGCGVLTGVGAAMNTASISPGMSVAIVGCGGVGLNVVQGARLAGAERVIAVDRLADKLALAERFGATDLVDASGADPVAQVKDMTSGRGGDVALEVVGSADTVLAATSMTRRGGQVVLVGLPSPDVLYPLPLAGILHSAPGIQGSTYGSSDIRRDIPKLIALYQSGDLLLKELVSGVLTLDQVNDGLDALDRGDVTRSVIAY